jgi:DNA-binding transcriptional MerR regulator
LLQESKAEIDISGVNPALSGDQNAPSGRAQEIQIQAALAEYSGVFDALKHWSWEVYRHVWYRIRQFWTEERWVRVTDDDRNMRWVGINKPVTLADHLQAKGIPFDPNDPQVQQQVGVQNAVAELDVDIILEDAPDSVTIQSEQFQALVDLKKADPSAIPSKAIIEASSLRNKDQILKMLEDGGIPPQVQQQMQALQKQLEQAQEQLKQAQGDQVKNQIDAAKNADEHAYKMADLELRRYEAETARIAALKPEPLADVPNGWPADGQTPGPTAHGAVAA